MTNMTNSRFHLEQPPVKRVALTVNFKAEPRLQGWHLDTFFHSLSSRYLSRQEVAPHPGDGHGAYEVLPSMGGWPIPKTEFAGDERSLSVQGDELEVAWNFGDNDEKHYPGFDSLIEELEQVLKDLVGSVEEHGVSIAPHEVECLYVNEIDGLSAPDLAVGVLTDWADVQARVVPEEGYVGVRLHGCGNTEEHHCSSYVMVDSNDDGPPVLSFRVGRALDEDESAAKAMRQAHEELIGLFCSHTPDRLRAQWGES